MNARLTRVVLLALALSCGGSTIDTSTIDGGTGGTGGTGGSASTGGSPGSGGDGTGGDATGGASGGTGGVGGDTGGSGGATPDYFACSGPGQCAAVEAACCTLCRTPEVSDFIGVNQIYVDAFRKDRCRDNAGCPPVACDPPPNPNIFAQCSADQQCHVFDVTRVPELSACQTSDDCVLRAGLGCCECGGGPWVAIRKDARVAIERASCDLNQGCPECAPAPPPGAIAICQDQVCRMIIPVE
jgi:hypothetical protein